MLRTGVRDYIHVMDLAAGHVAALAKIEKDHLRYRVRVNLIRFAHFSAAIHVDVLVKINEFGASRCTIWDWARVCPF